uniref:Uncharacterized protein n=1 Tax=Nelumbo nucifera TaxID=4432 RepID=A0A822Z090_NELNU|nr:TPA_asm: hypothetical protein HUJ06_008544 [Nelumbo nucifera]
MMEDERDRAEIRRRSVRLSPGPRDEQ